MGHTKFFLIPEIIDLKWFVIDKNCPLSIRKIIDFSVLFQIWNQIKSKQNWNQTKWNWN